MKNKFVLTEEESKRILSLHKEKIKEERSHLVEQEQDLDEDKGQDTGRVAAGSGIGATAGAIIGCIAAAIPTGGLACAGGAAIGASVGTAVGGFAGWFTTGGGYYDKVLNALKWCNAHRGKIGTPVNNDSTIRDIADDIAAAVEGFGRTDEVMIARSLRKLKSIPDLCRLNDIYRRRNTESLLSALDGDIDQDGEWRDYVWRPIEDLFEYSKKKSSDLLKENAKKCGWGTDIDGYKKSGWRCPKDGKPNPNPTPNPTPNPNPTPVPVPPVPNPRRRRYYFNYQDAINALNKKGCPTGGGGEENKQEDSFADDWRATENKPVDTTVNADNFSSWAN